MVNHLRPKKMGIKFLGRKVLILARLCEIIKLAFRKAIKMKEGHKMEIVNLKIMHVDYAKYRKDMDIQENCVKAVSYETCRQNLNEAMDVLGLNSKFFKENFKSNQPFQFNVKDKPILFELFDRFTSNEFVLVRKGLFLEVPLETIEFYINSFTTILKNLGIDDEIIGSQKECMLKYTQYSLAVAYDKIRKELIQIGKDIEKIIGFDNQLNNEDDTVFFQNVYEQLNLVKNYIRHVHISMSEYREHQEGFMAEVKALKPFLEKDRDAIKEKILNRINLDKVLHQNPRYVELEELMADCVENKAFLKHKIKDYVKLEKESIDISRDTQMELFGRIIDDEAIIPKKNEIERMPSKELLEMAVRDYIRFNQYKKSLEDDELLMGDIICKQMFED